MPVCTWVCALSFGRCRMSKFLLLVYLDFFESLRPTLQPPTAIAPTGTTPCRSVVVARAREVPRPTAASARRSECDSAAAVVGSDRALALNVETASSKASHGKACNRFVAHFNASTSIAIFPNPVP